jgi:hypothetical protein
VTDIISRGPSEMCYFFLGGGGGGQKAPMGLQHLPQHIYECRSAVHAKRKTRENGPIVSIYNVPESLK